MARIMIVGFGNEGMDMAASLGPVAHIAGIAGNPAPPTGIEIVVLDGDRGDPLEAVRYWDARGMDPILLSQELSVDTVLPAIRAGAREILQKPVDMEKLERVLHEMLERRRPTTHGHTPFARIQHFHAESRTCDTRRFPRTAKRRRNRAVLGTKNVSHTCQTLSSSALSRLGTSFRRTLRLKSYPLRRGRDNQTGHGRKVADARSAEIDAWSGSIESKNPGQLGAKIGAI